ncbi:hypothetical protein ACM7NO_26420 [Pseudomonas aeruginosa]
MIATLIVVMLTLCGLIAVAINMISVLVDEQHAANQRPDIKARYRGYFKASDFISTSWAAANKISLNRWAMHISKFAFVLLLAFILISGSMLHFVQNNPWLCFLSLVFLTSLSNGGLPEEHHDTVRYYMPLLATAVAYQFGLAIEPHVIAFSYGITSPSLARLFESCEPEIVIAILVFLLSLILPIPLTAFDKWLSTFFAKVTLNFVRDILRITTKPETEIEQSLRRIAKESIVQCLQLAAIALAAIAFVNGVQV